MINIGDRVTVYFERVEAEYNCEIVRIPVRPHDSWELKRLDGTILYIQNYAKMVRSTPIQTQKKPEPVLSSGEAGKAGKP